MTYQYNLATGLTKEKLLGLKKKTLGLAVVLGTIGALAAPTMAAPPASPGHYGTASPNAQCGTAAGSGAYADEYGNFGYLGDQGGANGYQTGLSNSAVCGNRQDN